jgi:capsular polysaccharide transport system permease protein
MSDDSAKKAGLPLVARGADARAGAREGAARIHDLSAVRAAAERPARAVAAVRPRRQRTMGHGGKGADVKIVPDVETPESAAPRARPAPAVDPAEADKVISFIQRLQQEAATAATHKRPTWLISALVCILLPTVLASVYYFFIASDRFVSEARFAVRSNDTGAADVLGMITGMPKSTVVSDSYIVSDYILSRDMVEQLEHRLPFRQIYSTDKADWFNRLNPAVPIERLVDYWNKWVDVYYDSTKDTIAVQVTAFTPEEARRVVGEIVDVTRSLVNDLSAQSRRDAVRFAASEVARAELRVRGARDDMLKFRTEHNDFDPSQSATAALSLVAQLQSARAQLNSQLSAVSGYLAATAPSVQMLKAKIQATDDEIARVQATIASTGDAKSKPAGSAANTAGKTGVLASEVAKYQELTLSQEFAEKAYEAALASLERARSDSDRTQSYLAIYMNPSTPEYSLYPRRAFNVFVVFLLASVLWAIGSLGVMSVRDHMA